MTEKFKLSLIFLTTFYIINAYEEVSIKTNLPNSYEEKADISFEDQLSNFFQEFFDRIGSMHMKQSESSRLLLDEMTNLFINLKHRITKINLETDIALTALTFGNNKIEEVINKSVTLYDEILKVDLNLNTELKKINIKEEPHLSERILYLKSRIYFILFRRLNKILNRVLEKRTFPKILIRVAEKTYFRLSNNLVSVVDNLENRIEATIEIGENPSKKDVSNIIKYSSLFVDSQRLRFDEINLIISKNINADSNIKSWILKRMQIFKLQLENRLTKVTRSLKNNSNFPPNSITQMEMSILFLKGLIKEVNHLLRVVLE